MFAIFNDAERRRAIVAPFVATMMIVLVGAVAFSVDVGYMVVSNEEMQNAVDASALAATSGLVDGNDIALYRGLQYAASNKVAGTGLSSEETSVTIGNWNGATQTFFALTGGELWAPNAVRIVGTRPDLQLFFAQALGIHSTAIQKEAIASAGSGRCAGIWGLNGIDSQGNFMTDSYIAAQGPYGPGNMFPNGDICSNSDITMNGNVDIYGDAMYGEGSDFIGHGNAYTVWGIVGEHGIEITVPEFDINVAAMFNDNASIGLTDRDRDPFRGSPWDLVLNSNDGLTLLGGTYYFTSVMINGQATLTVSGPTEIYISGPAMFTGGGLINSGQDPADLVIYSTGDELKLAGNAEFFGAIVAPETDVMLQGTADYYGTILGGTLRLQGTAVVHVDEALVADLYNIKPVVPALVK